MHLAIFWLLAAQQEQELHSFFDKRSSLTISSYAASEKGFLVNSHLLVGFDEAMLINTQLLRSEAKHVVSLIKHSGKKLTTIFITHDDPDDYLGLDVIHAAFPDAKILATPKVAAAIKAKAQKAIDDRKETFGADLATTFIVPEAYDKPTLPFAGENVVIRELQAGESGNGAVLYVPSLQLIFAGDLISNQVHLWLVDASIEGWIKNLAAARAVGTIANVLPGHGAPGPATLFDDTKKYLQAFAAAVKGANAVKVMEQKFPGYKLPQVLELSVAARR
jgi:glyoxylase-like metal-dependent hydrolase (beta-lactamase superfamily II)